MRRKRRDFSPFGLAFLDVMSCGFGAVVLLFLIIKHQADANMSPVETGVAAEIAMLHAESNAEQVRAVELRDAIAEVERQLTAAESRIRESQRTVDQQIAKIPRLPSEKIAALKAELKSLEAQKEQLKRTQTTRDKNTRDIAGDDKRVYLTGLNLGGRHILVLLDTSASMLDETIVNVIRRRNMSDKKKRAAPKWRQALAIVNWLSAHIPTSANYQIYTFNTQVKPALPKSAGKWLSVGDAGQLDKAVKSLYRLIPNDGTSLEKAFGAAARLQPKPDNILLITDGLPTQAANPSRAAKISGSRRLKLFDQAVAKLPRGVPVNVILLPMEGDPMAAAAFWKLAQASKGSLISPASDWP